MKVLVDGQLIEYKHEGKGKTIVLLHGWGATLSTFDLLSAELTQKFRVLRFDFPGFGGSPKPDDSWGVGEYAKLTSELLKKLKVDDVYAFIGHSFGGRVIIKGFATGVLTSEKVVLMGSAGVKPPQSLKRQLYKTIAKTGKAATALPGVRGLRPLLRRKLYESAGATDYLHAKALQKIFINTVNEDLLPLVPRITVPTLLIWGENDDQTLVADARKIKQQIKDSSLVVVPEAGHFVYVDDFETVVNELRKFL